MKEKRKVRTKRIYYGPPGREKSLWWDVKVTDATWPVIVNGDVLDALKAESGVTVGCAMSNVVVGKRNVKAFPHPVHLASFTKSTAVIVDKLKKNGTPEHAFVYRHAYGHITDRNDNGTLRQMVQETPTLMERSFLLRPPRERPKASGKTAGQTKKDDLGKINRGQSFVPRGALARAVKAGRMSKHAANHIVEVAKIVNE